MTTSSTSSSKRSRRSSTTRSDDDLLTCPRCGDLTPSPAEACATCEAKLVPVFVQRGYRHVSVPGHRLAQRNGRYTPSRVREHRLVAEAMLGRSLRPEEVVHHVNGDTVDNRPENLVVCTNNGEHRRRFHSQEQAA